MPNVYVRIVDNGKILVEGNEHGTKIVIKDFSVKEQLIGELQVKSENVFKEYWNKPQVTKESFVENGWFLTGMLCTQYLVYDLKETSTKRKKKNISN